MHTDAFDLAALAATHARKNLIHSWQTMMVERTTKACLAAAAEAAEAGQVILHEIAEATCDFVEAQQAQRYAIIRVQSAIAALRHRGLTDEA